MWSQLFANCLVNGLLFLLTHVCDVSVVTCGPVLVHETTYMVECVQFEHSGFSSVLFSSFNVNLIK